MAKSMDQGHMLLIVVLVGALLWMFMKDHKGGVCSLFEGGKQTFIVGAGKGSRRKPSKHYDSEPRVRRTIDSDTRRRRAEEARKARRAQESGYQPLLDEDGFDLNLLDFQPGNG